MPTTSPTPPLTEACVRVIHGAIGAVKAYPSREVTVINVEIPEDFHVEATNLLYGRDVLLWRSNLAANASYGVINTQDQPTQERAEAADACGEQAGGVQYIHGHVALVRAIPSRQVSVISIEIPEDHHVPATALLYGRDALAVPVSLGSSMPYGLLRPGSPATDLPSPAPRQQRGAGSTQRSSARTGNAQEPVNIVKWLGARCTEAGFMDWLGVRNEAQAAERVRVICDVESRREIPQSQHTIDRFLRQIYEPYRLYESQQQRRGYVRQPPPEDPAPRDDRRGSTGDAFASLVRPRSP